MKILLVIFPALLRLIGQQDVFLINIKKKRKINLNFVLQVLDISQW
jgi:hypothetical protein